jgi:cytochrome c oxidase subunit 2
MAWPATKTILAMRDTSASDITIKVTGYQWKWGYDYLQDGFGFYSNLSTPLAQIENREKKATITCWKSTSRWFVPIGAKVRILVTAGDVLHSWSVRRSASCRMPSRDSCATRGSRPRKLGTYRGQCSELCGKEHGFMPSWSRSSPRKTTRRGSRLQKTKVACRRR